MWEELLGFVNNEEKKIAVKTERTSRTILTRAFSNVSVNVRSVKGFEIAGSIIDLSSKQPIEAAHHDHTLKSSGKLYAKSTCS